MGTVLARPPSLVVQCGRTETARRLGYRRRLQSSGWRI